MTTLYIKNMVCNRCIMVIENELEKVNLNAKEIKLGEVLLDSNPTQKQLSDFEQHIQQLGFELIDDKRKRLVEQIKNIIIQQVHHQNGVLKSNLSDVLSTHLRLDYSYLSTLFSEVEGTTIEKYYIAQKIERVKELLVYDELTLSEIADLLNYSSVAYLSNQFKKVTSLSPTQFKQASTNKRKPLDEI